MRHKRFLALAITTALLTSTLVACGNDGSEQEQTTTAGQETSAEQTTEGSGEVEGTTTSDNDPFGKYGETVTVSSVKDLGSAALEFPPGDSLDDNSWTRYFEENLNIKLNWLWGVNSDQYAQKVNVAITSDEIPDLMIVNATQLKLMYENQQLMDITEVYNNYVAPFTDEVLNSDNGLGLDAATVDGKLYAIPHVGSPLQSAKVLWVRTDWLDNLGLELPQTRDDFFKVAQAFTEDDPDGNSENDTYGLAVYKDLSGSGYADLTGFYNMFGAYIDTWIEKDGAIAYSSIQPEMKDALTALQDMYQNGQIDPEFGVKDANKVNEDVNAGRIGMFFGDFWNAAWINDAKVANPEFEFVPIAIPADGTTPAKAQIPFSTNNFYAVSAESEHPEAVIKLLNTQLEKSYGETAEPLVFNITPEGYGPYAYAPTSVEPAMKNFDAAKHVSEAIETGDTSKLNLEELNYYEMSLLSLDGDHTNNNWHQLKMFGPNGSLTVMYKYWEDGNTVSPSFYGAPTDNMVQKMPTLDKLQITEFTKIITGGDVNGFDTFVDQWFSLGGEDITTDVNEWFANR